MEMENEELLVLFEAYVGLMRAELIQQKEMEKLFISKEKLHELFQPFKDIPLGSLSDDYNGRFPEMRKRRGL